MTQKEFSYLGLSVVIFSLFDSAQFVFRILLAVYEMLVFGFVLIALGLPEYSPRYVEEDNPSPIELNHDGNVGMPPEEERSVWRRMYDWAARALGGEAALKEQSQNQVIKRKRFALTTIKNFFCFDEKKLSLEKKLEGLVL